MAYYPRQLGCISCFLFVFIKRCIATLGGAGRKEMDMQHQASFISTYNKSTRNLETRKRDKENGEKTGKYAHFFP